MAADRGLGAIVVGTGIGVMTHLPALRAAGFEVRALVGRDPAKTLAWATQFAVPHACTSVTDALALSDIDVVAVATPPFSHCEIVLEAISAGKHVLCEKPFARDSAEAREMLHAAEATGIVHLLGTEFRFWGPQAWFTRLLRQGVVGEPRYFVSLSQMDVLADPSAEMPAWFESAEQGGSWFTGAGTHTIDQVRTSLGEFERVSASLQTLSGRPEATADDLFTVTFRLRNGVEGLMHGASSVTGPPVRSSKVVGTNGAVWMDGFEVWVDDGSGARHWPCPRDLEGAAPVAPPAELLRTEYERLHSLGIDLEPYTRVYKVMRDRILGRALTDGPTAATFDDGVALQAVIDAVQRSAREHSTVIVDDL